MNTIIIGAGASGLACAIRLKQNKPDDEVVIIERFGTSGKKILATGNGRCNLSNINAEKSDTVLDFFSALGLVTRTDSEGRIYPYSNKATTVLEILLDSCSALGVKIINDCHAERITPDGCVITDNGEYIADNIVIACGGKAQEKLGSNGDGYKLLSGIGHTITPLRPELVSLTSPNKNVKALNGQRVKCRLTILIDKEPVAGENGEVLFTAYGLSGIVTMNLSKYVSENFAESEPKRCHAVIDLIPDMTEEQVYNHICKYGNLNGILGSQLSHIIEKMAEGDFTRMAKYSKSWSIIINGTKGYDFAQITGGGAAVNEFDGYRSKLCDKVYACGEVLDRQFECGGYNLNFAWLSGIGVADQIADL